jgi:hypothetical protein
MRTFLSLLILSLLFTGCIFDNEKTESPNIVGLWQQCYTGGNTITFRPDNTYYSTFSLGQGGYSINNNTIMLIANGKTTQYKIMLNGNFLSISNDTVPTTYYDFIRINK